MSDYVVKKPHLADTTDPGYLWSSLPTVALGGMALGGGARLLRNLFDLARDEPTEGAVRINRPSSSVTEMPIEVTPEEARELKRRGINVRKVLAKEGQEATKSVPIYKTSPTLLGGLGLGIAGTAGGLGGWYLADKIIDKLRQSAAKKDVDIVRERIKRILDDRPDREDDRLYGTMKAAEDAYFSQPAEKQMKIAVGLSDLPWILSALVGGGLTFGALSGYQQSRSKSPSSAAAKRMKQYLSSRPAVKSQISMVPVLREALREEEEEEDREERAPMPVPIQVVEQPGSPATQARKNEPAVQSAAPQPAAATPNWF